ncbi:MAG: 23S rRNA pseudouridine(2604) synthase RluF [Chitinophagales bacterium]|nr:23S rRNA pseudouridine(2604) synthase RluF [Chitinophagales bacterium]
MHTHNNNEAELVSLNKYISSTGFCSRREADKYIEQGRVTVNGEPAFSGTRVADSDTVEIDGEKLKGTKKKTTIYIALNKPVGITSTTDLKDKTNIISFINYPKRIFPIGRLDKDSDGLIFLTNDGDIVNKILRAGNFHEKEYIVTVNKALTPEFIQQMSNGVPVLGKMTRKCIVKKEGNKRFRIILTQGMNRQIRRMCQHLDYKVMSLTRVRIMNVHLGNLPVGKWRLLTQPEIDEMNRLVASSSKTQSAEERTVKEKHTQQKQEVKTKQLPKNNEQKSPAKPKKKSYKEWRKR